MSYSIDKLLEVSKDDLKFVKKILTMFVDEINEKLNLIQNSLTEKNYKEITSIAHQFKSNFQLLNRNDIVALSKEIEKCADAEIITDECKNKTKELINSIQVLRNQIKKDLDDRKY